MFHQVVCAFRGDNCREETVTLQANACDVRPSRFRHTKTFACPRTYRLWPSVQSQCDKFIPVLILYGLLHSTYLLKCTVDLIPYQPRLRTFNLRSTLNPYIRTDSDRKWFWTETHAWSRLRDRRRHCQVPRTIVWRRVVESDSMPISIQ